MSNPFRQVPWSPEASDAWEDLYLELSMRRPYGQVTFYSIAIGAYLGTRLPERAIKIFAALAFAVFGVLLVAEGLGLVPVRARGPAGAVFMIVTCTIARRTAIFPRPLILAGYAIALVMLLSLAFLQWIVLLFPVWVCVASGYILIAEKGASGRGIRDGAG